MTFEELKMKLAALAITDERQLNKVICGLIGHSRIQTTCFGYYHCARCDAQLGDALGSVYNTKKIVIVGHACDVCRANFKECTWKDKLNVRDPFAKDYDASDYLFRLEPVEVPNA